MTINWQEFENIRKHLRKLYVEPAVDHIKLQMSGALEKAYDDGHEHGRSYERAILIEQLKEYEKDSVVAKLLRQLIEEQHQD